MKQKSKFFYHLGNLMIILAVAGFVYIFYPIVQMYLFPPKIQNTLPTNGTFLTIPKISAQAPVLENIDPWDSVSYQKTLKSGIAHAKGTSLPGQDGTIFLFAHSSAPPWELTHYNTIFLRLASLEKGDVIEIVRNGQKFSFEVTSKKEVWPNEIKYLEDLDKNQLILQTCTPVGTSLKRLLVFAQASN